MPNSTIFGSTKSKANLLCIALEGQTLIGTTEIRQDINEPIQCSKEELDYLIAAYNHYHNHAIQADEIAEIFAGVRPLIKSAIKRKPSQATREYVIHREKQLVTVLGGKWTTTLALARQVSKTVNG